MNDERFMNRLKKLRTLSGLTQSELSEKIGVSKSLVSLYETGKKLPSTNSLHSIAELFNVSIDYLVGRTSELGHYSDSETEEIAIAIKSNTLRKRIFELSELFNDEDLQRIINIMEILVEFKYDIKADPL